MSRFGFFCVCFAAAACLAAAREGDVLAKTNFLTSDEGWILTGTGWNSEGVQRERDRLVVEDDRSNPGKTWKFRSPPAFLGGDKSLAYNGWLSFELGHFEYESLMQSLISSYDVILVCKNKNQNLGLKGVFVDDGATSHTYHVRLEESFSPQNSTASWQRVKTGLQAAQRDMVSCLQSLQAIEIRGSFFKGFEATWIRDIMIREGQVDKAGSPEWTNALSDKSKSVDSHLERGDMKYFPRSAPASEGACCNSRTCVSNDKYEILFDRPGCAINWDPICNAGNIASSKINKIVEARSVSEGRRHVVNQLNMGLRASPLKKPFRHPFYLKSLPRICSAATLTVAVHGDLAYSNDNIVVYGEDGSYLGTLFAGNLTYERDDPHYAQTSETTPYVDSIVISQEYMTKYAADEQIQIVVASERRKDFPKTFSGTQESITFQTNFCDSPPCDLSGKVIFRWMKLKFSAATCYVARTATDVSHTFNDKIHTQQPLNISLSFATPDGDAAVPGGDGVLTVVTDSNIFERHQRLEVREIKDDGTAGDHIGDLFASESFTRRQQADAALTGWGGDTSWGSANVPRLHADTLLIPRATLQRMVAGGKTKIQLWSTLPDNTMKFVGKFSPIFFSYPLFRCFMHAIKKGPYMNVHIERDSSLYWEVDGFPQAGADVSFTVAAHWYNHLRYNSGEGNLPELPLHRGDQDTSSPSSSQVTNHRKWPHGYNYLQLRAGLDGEWIADIFLKDYTQYSTRGYIMDTVMIPKEKFNYLVSQHPNGVSGRFSFSLWVPPGNGLVQLRSIVVGYPVSKASDASTFDDAEFDTEFVNMRYPQAL